MQPPLAVRETLLCLLEAAREIGVAVAAIGGIRELPAY